MPSEQQRRRRAGSDPWPSAGTTARQVTATRQVSFNEHLIEQYAHLQATTKSAAARQATITRLQRLISPHLPNQRQAALDLGAGQGELVEALQCSGFAAVNGVELSPSQLEQALRHGCRSLHHGDGEQMLQSLEPASLDLVSCFDVLEHLSLEQCARWFDQISRVLRPGGRLIAQVPNGLSPFHGQVYWGDLTHRWCPVPENLQTLCRSSGLHWLGAYDNIGASASIKGRLRRLSWWAVRSVLATASTLETGCNAFAQPWSRSFVFVAQRPGE